MDLRDNSGRIAALTPAQINTLFAAAGGITFNIGAITGTIVDNDNAAPTLSQAAFNLVDTNEDTTSTVTTVAALLADAGWADLNVSPLKGVAVTGTTGLGEWQYNTGSPDWTPFDLLSTVSEQSALLLDEGTSVRYVPDNKTGETATLSFRAWDRTTGTASTDNNPGNADTATNGGTTAFSTASSTASLVVTSVNDPPVFVAPILTINEDSSFSAFANVLLAASSDPDGDVLSIRGGISFPVSNGLRSAFSSNDFGGNLIQMSFTPLPNFDGSITFNFSVFDGTVSVPGSITVDILPINDAPVVNAAALTLNEGETVTLSAANFTVVDPDNTSFTFSVSGLAGGIFQLSTAAGTPVTAFTSADLSGGQVQFVDDGNEVAPAFSITANDGELSSNTLGTAINFTPVNDPPVAANDSAQTSLNTGVNIGVVANDTDVDGLALRVSAVNPGANGSTVVRPDLVSVRYTPDTGFSGFDNFTYTVSDGAGGSATANVRVLVASITGTDGNDTQLGTLQVDHVLGLDGADRILAFGGADYVDAGPGADTITGGDGADTLLGGNGADTFLTSSTELAGDQIDGGSGTDTLVITNAPASLPADLSFTNLEQISFSGGLLVQHTSHLDLSSLTLASGSNNSITGGVANSRITGTGSADNISDSAGNDDLRGASGNDTIQGGFGQDTIRGGTGNDTLYGGSATTPNDFVRDIFVFDTSLNAANNVDQIMGFQANNQDKIQLDPSIFTAITGGSTTGLDANEFRAVNGGDAQAASDRIIFDPLTGNLFYDADGSAGGAKVLFATLVGLTGTLDVTDFVVTGSP